MPTGFGTDFFALIGFGPASIPGGPAGGIVEAAPAGSRDTGGEGHGICSLF